MTLADATSQALQQAILAGQFPAGSQLAPEFALMLQLGVSRTTLREALKRLEEQGLIVRRRGRGTFVRERSIVKDLSLNFGISEMSAQAGLALDARSTSVGRQPAPAEAAAALAVPEGEPLMVIERVRAAAGRPVVWSRHQLPAARLGPRALTTTDLARGSFYQYLANTLQIRVTHGVMQVVPIMASAELARQLDIRLGTPLLRLAQIDFDSADEPVLYSVECHLPGTFVFQVNRTGPSW
jgi:GntR family transcriptional regulator